MSRIADFRTELWTAATVQNASLFDNWFDPIEAGLRDRVREFLAGLMFEGELDEVLAAAALRARAGCKKRTLTDKR